MLIGQQNVQPPINERQARELAKLPAEHQAEAWETVLKRTDNQPTTRIVREVVEYLLTELDAEALYFKLYPEDNPENYDGEYISQGSEAGNREAAEIAEIIKEESCETASLAADNKNELEKVFEYPPAIPKIPINAVDCIKELLKDGKWHAENEFLGLHSKTYIEFFINVPKSNVLQKQLRKEYKKRRETSNDEPQNTINNGKSGLLGTLHVMIRLDLIEMRNDEANREYRMFP
jgi:hypothetical protein